MRTLVIQSYRTDTVADWISICLGSVRQWASLHDYDYRFVGDEIFDRVPDWYRDKTQTYPQIATDLGRLELINEALIQGYDRVAWLDADVLIFNPEPFTITMREGYAMSRELWVQQSASGGLKLYRSVHNAYCVFCQDNAFLDFYRDACKRIVARMEPQPDKGLVPQIVGPKFLSALHNMIGFDLLDDIAMVSPSILHDLANSGGDALPLLAEAATAPVYGANLCASLEPDNPQDMAAICQRLLKTQSLFNFNFDEEKS